jgi:hypothetical protein
VAEHIANPWGGPSVIGQDAAFSGHPPLELIPELFESEFEEDGTDHGSFTIDDQLVSYTVGELTVGD